MRFGSSVRMVFLVAGTAALSGCGFLPSTDKLEFAVTGDLPTDHASTFRNIDPKINEVQAQGYCADGYEKLSETTVPSDSGTLQEWRVRCAPYVVSFLPF